MSAFNPTTWVHWMREKLALREYPGHPTDPESEIEVVFTNAELKALCDWIEQQMEKEKET